MATAKPDTGIQALHWSGSLARVLGREQAVVVTLNVMVGSAPREAGSRMIVSRNGIVGSIGGGNLEHQAIAHARQLLKKGERPRQEHRPFALGPALNQCCGGTVTLLFEQFVKGAPAWLDDLLAAAGEQTAVVMASAIDCEEPFKALIGLSSHRGDLPEEIVRHGRELLRNGRGTGIETLETADGEWWLERLRLWQQPLVLFGAGHVGQAVARLLADLPFDVTWVDSRIGLFPDQVGANIDAVQSENVLAEVRRAPPGSIFVVMTHSHQLDEDICFEALNRADFAWLGLIGSVTKRRRFVQRLARRGIAESDLERLICPIGLSGIRGKQPATIALSLMAQLMQDDE